MSDPQLLDYLLGEGPEPRPGQLADFTEEALPDGLEERTLNRVAVERTRLSPAVQQQTWRRAWAVGLAIAASLVIALTVPESTETPQGNLENMTAKGLEQSAPMVHLKLARVESGEAVRHRSDRAYRAGESLLFRVQSNSSGWITLLNAQGDRLSAVLQTQVEVGDNDLVLPNGEIAQWQFDSTDQSGFFAVISSESPLPSETLVQQLRTAADERPFQVRSFCLTAQALGWQCDAIEVMVTQ